MLGRLAGVSGTRQTSIVSRTWKRPEAVLGMIENSRESVTYRLHAIPTLPPRWNDQIVPSADLVFSLLFLSLFFFLLIFILDLASRDSRKVFRIFRGFFFLSFSLFFYWICRTSFISLSSLTGILENFFEFFLFFVELDLFDRRFSFSRWLFLIRIVDNFFEFFFFFVRFLELRNLFFCRWFSYPSVNYSFFIEVFEIIFELLTIFLFWYFSDLFVPFLTDFIQYI